MFQYCASFSTNYMLHKVNRNCVLYSVITRNWLKAVTENLHLRVNEGLVLVHEEKRI
jgi:hypothetical protein